MDILTGLLAGVLPFIAAGYALHLLRIKKAERYIGIFVDFSLYALVPAFVFFAVWTAPLGSHVNGAAAVAAVSLAVVACGAVFAFMFSKIYSMNFRDSALPVMFMNSAYLAIPLDAALAGKPGMFLGVVYNIVIMLLHFSAGIVIVSGSISEIFRVPVLYCAVLGAAANIAGMPVTAGVLGVSKALNGITLPAMLVLVGYQVTPVSLPDLKKIIWATLVRMLGGLAAALAICKIFGIIGDARTVCLVSSSMPSAINSYILAKKYDADFSFASSMITVGLVFSAVVVPVIIWIK